MTGDLIERLLKRKKIDLSDIDAVRDYLIDDSYLHHEVVDEIASLRTALATERDRAERAEKRADANADHARLANANLKLASDASAANLARAEAIEASLAEAKRLLKAALHHAETEGDDTLITVVRRFLAQESNDGR